MTFELIFDEEAIGFLNDLPKELKKRIFNKITKAKENPFHFFERLEERKDYKLRIGDYRIIYKKEVDEYLKNSKGKGGSCCG